MQVKCAQCNAGYTLPAERLVPGRRVQFACRHCGERIVVQVPNDAGAEPVQPAAAPARRGPDPLARPLAEPQVEARPDEPRWFVAAPDGSHRKLAESELEAEIRAGAVTGETLVWRKGLAEWLPAAATERWQAIVAALEVAPDAATVDDPALAEVAMAASPGGQRVRRQTDLAFAASLPVGGHSTRADSGGAEGETRWGIAAVGDDDGGSHDAGSHDGGSRDGGSQAREAEAAALAASQVAGLSGHDASQAAVSLPVVRAARLDAPAAQRSRERLSERRMPSAGHRLPAHRADPVSRGSSQDPRSSQGAAPGGAAAHGHAHAVHAAAAAHPSAAPMAGSPRDPAVQPRDGGEAGSDGLWAPATDTYVGPRDNFTRRLGGSNERDLLLAHVERERSGQRELRRWQIATLAASCVALIGLAIAGAAMMHARRAQQALAACTAQTPASAHRAAGADAHTAAALVPARAP